MPMTSNILIVDGNVRMCDSLIALLRDYDYRLSKSHSVDDAIGQLEQGDFDLVILDLFAPTRDGFRIIEYVNGNRPDCLAIIISGYATVESAVAALKKGVYDYIRKPFEPEEFITTVKNAIDHKKLQSERKQARKALRKSQRELAIRNRISQIFLTSTDGEIYPEVLQVVLEALESETGLLWVTDDREAMICPQASKGGNGPRAVTKRDSSLPHGSSSGHIDRVLINKKSRVSNGPIPLPDGHMTILRALSTPLLYHNRVIGVLTAANKKTDYVEEDKRLIETIASHLAPIIHARLERIHEESERKRLEKERAKLQSRLQHVQKMEAIGTLTSGIAHDLNNILAAIMGFTEMALLETSKRTKQHYRLEQVLEAGQRLKDLVQQILAFNSPHPLEKQVVRVSDVIRDALKLIRASLPSTIEIQEHFESLNGAVLADPTQIHQIVMNLSSNAAHAMNDNGGVLKVSVGEGYLNSNKPILFPDAKEGPCVKLSVSDTGAGMDKSTVERIFDPYYTTKDKSIGTGLGLATVHGIVKSFGGSIDVASRPGKGSTFDVFLPKVDYESAPHAKPDDRILEGSEHILFVDDESALVAVGSEILESLGYEVTATTSSLEALKLFQADPLGYDLLITDMTMPHLTGKDLALKTMEIRKGFPTIICTGFSEKITEIEAKKIGIKAFLMKPFNLRLIAKTIREVLD